MVNTFSHSPLAAALLSRPRHLAAWRRRALMRRVQASNREANVFHIDFQVCNDYAGGLAAAARVACPATLVLGDRDQMTRPKQAAELAAALRARTVALVAGHALDGARRPTRLLSALRDALVPAGDSAEALT